MASSNDSSFSGVQTGFSQGFGSRENRRAGAQFREASRFPDINDPAIRPLADGPREFNPFNEAANDFNYDQSGKRIPERRSFFVKLQEYSAIAANDPAHQEGNQL